jgi:voltage-gated potassium channel Kch
LRKHIKQIWENYHWVAIAGLWLIAFVLGYIGVKKQLLAFGEARSFWDPFYRAMQLFVMEDSAITSGPALPWELEVARFLAPVVTTYTAVAALIAIFYEKFQLFRLRFIKNHVVICGLGKKGLLLAKGFQERGDRVVVIEKNQDNSLLRQCRGQGAIVLVGNTTDMELLRRVGVHKAKYVVSVCGDDGTNAEVALHSHELVGDRKGNKVLTCFVHIVDPQLCNLLREREIMTGKVDSFRLELFNIFDNGARALLNEHPFFSKTQDSKYYPPRLLVVGLGRMGESLVVHAARSWWVKHSEIGER